MKLNYYLNDDINCYCCLNLQIIVRTKGLRCVLGRVIGRASGTQVSGDAEEALQCRRLIASFVDNEQLDAEDVKHVDHPADEVHEQPQEPVTVDVRADTQGFSGGPKDTST